jgi:hypothetical protein
MMVVSRRVLSAAQEGSLAFLWSGIARHQVARPWLAPTAWRCLQSAYVPSYARPAEKAAKMLERETGFEPATSSLGSWHSTTELLPPRGAIASGNDCIRKKLRRVGRCSALPGQRCLIHL